MENVRPRPARRPRRAAAGGQRHRRGAARGPVHPGDEPRARPRPRAPGRPDLGALGPGHGPHAARRGPEGAGPRGGRRRPPTLRARAAFRRPGARRAPSWYTPRTTCSPSSAVRSTASCARGAGVSACASCRTARRRQLLLRDARLGSRRGHLRRPAPGDAQPPAAHRPVRVRGAPRAPRAGQALHARPVRGLPHLQVAPRGKPGGYVDDVLRERGRTRTVARAVPYFLTALQLAGETDYVLTISERLARASRRRWGSRSWRCR
jgi:hypothetical protein